MIEKLNVEDIRPSSRRYPAIIFDRDRVAGDQILETIELKKDIEGKTVFQKINLNLAKGDKVVVISKDSRAVTAFFEIIAGNDTDFEGEFKWGVTTTQSYLPLENAHFFENGELNLVDWLRQYAQTEEEREDVYLRGFLGKMIFSGEEALKKCTVLSGGEKVRCMLSRMMMKRANVLLLDEPTNHLDLESIQAFNNSLKNFKGTILFATHDHEFAHTVANRVIELTPKGIIDRYTTFEEYYADDKIKELREKMYN
jgi:ATPase subunit of ABC transporter with duplicated ATPase domains